ncbi:hypothetical protein B188_11270 [Candidatus Brocadiaceae bacterium B188]|nr:hypothetical protein B188_11270 [Candidatus Brocadiaceae bacterium B188]
MEHMNMQKMRHEVFMCAKGARCSGIVSWHLSCLLRQ